jgi:exosortase C (VPDSG-CTERM-specific)
MEFRSDETLTRGLVGSRAAESTAWWELPRPQRQRIRWFVACLVVLALLFIQPLVRLVAHAAANELHSHIPLVPLLAGYLLYLRRRSLAAVVSRTSIAAAVPLVGISLLALAAGGWWRETLSGNDELALMTLAFVSLVAAGGFLCLGTKWMAVAAFPLSFLIFMVPMPDAMARTLETASMMASADVAAWLFRMTGTPLLRQDQLFMLPGIVLKVAEECSGIRSSWVLFITSLLASHLFLESPWRRLVLVAFVIPLGIVRNGFRVLVIGLLCVHVGRHMIDSAIHHHGGPVFFLLSLGPLFLFLWWLRRQETER